MAKLPSHPAYAYGAISHPVHAWIGLLTMHTECILNAYWITDLRSDYVPFKADQLGYSLVEHLTNW